LANLRLSYRTEPANEPDAALYRSAGSFTHGDKCREETEHEMRLAENRATSRMQADGSWPLLASLD